MKLPPATVSIPAKKNRKNKRKGHKIKSHQVLNPVAFFAFGLRIIAPIERGFYDKVQF